jgi:hypothetical protein
LEGALNTEANLPLFMRQFQPPFPVGMANQMDALQFMEISPMIRTFVPYIAFIDRKGMIRAQFTGGDLTDETLEKVLRENAEKLVNESTAKPKTKPVSH